MVVRRSELDNSQFSWRRTSAIASSVVLHTFAFLIVLVPIMQPEAKAFVPNDSTVVDIIPPPLPVQAPPPPPPPPATPKPPKQQVVAQIDPPELPALEAVVEEPSHMAEAALAQKPTERFESIKVAPRVNLSYRRYHKPPYPAQAVRMRHEGEVILRVLVGVGGSVIDIKVEQSSGYAELDRAAIKAARGWQFNPGTRNGVPYTGWARVPVNFTLNSY